MEENSDFSHKIYQSDPLLFQSYIGKEVKILMNDNNTISGIVYTVDPVSESVVLLQGCQQDHLKIVFGHAVKTIEISSNTTHDLPEMFTNAPTNVHQPILASRKKTVLKILKENRFPVTEKNDVLTIEDILTITPPYEPKDCSSTNSIILGRIQNLLSSIHS